ncbi:sulfotransferase 1A1-like [Diadema antillarum]|uniref:sulfotransferase 1A1-like n=1 Tax=Diadema antillarum TaxID=105358 RepID=UPI003A8A4B4E
MAGTEPSHALGMHLYKGILLPNVVLDSSVEALQTFEVRPDDIWLCTYPKSGTHWMGEIVGLILTRGVPEKMDRSLATSCAEMIDMKQKMPATREEELKNPMDLTPFLDKIAAAPSPRLIITHLPLRFLPPKLEERGRVIYVARNPKDVLNSLYSMMVKGNIDPNMPKDAGLTFLLSSFMEDKAHFGPWREHVREFWKIRGEKNAGFFFYESMKKDPVGSVRDVANLLGVDLTAEELQKVVEHSSFKGMSKTYATGEASATEGNKDFFEQIKTLPFLGKGYAGQWKDRFTVAQNEIFDKFYNEKMTAEDPTFEFE